MAYELNDNTYYLDPNIILSIEQQLSQWRSEHSNKFLHPVPPSADESMWSDLPLMVNLHYDYSTIRSLGKRIAPGQAEEVNKDTDVAKKAIALLSASGRPFSMACFGENSGKISFALGFVNDKEQVKASSVLNSVFGSSQLERCALPAAANTKQWTATAFPVRADTAMLDQSEKTLAPLQWADIAAAAVIETSCCVQLDFQPIDKKWIEEMLVRLRSFVQKLKYYLKHQVQISANHSGNVSVFESTNTNGNANVIFLGGGGGTGSGKNDGYNGGFSISLNADVIDVKAEHIVKLAEYRIRLLEQCLQSGWMISVRVSSAPGDDNDAHTVQNAMAAALMSLGYSCQWQEGCSNQASLILPSYLAAGLISFPIRNFVGFELEEHESLNLNPPETGNRDKSIPLGALCWNGLETSIELRIPREELNRHAFVCGMTGSGKTTTVCSLLSSLSDLHYFVIEPVKGEYHYHLKNAQRFTMIPGQANGLHMNPFWFPTGTNLQYHIDSLKTIITSAFDLSAAMPNILEQCLYRVYRNCGWNFITGTNIHRGQLPEEDLYPTFSLLCAEIEAYLKDAKFGEELKGNYEGALLSRLKSFTSGSKGALLNTTAHIDFDSWAARNVVLELDALADDADKAIVMGTLLVQYFQYIKKQFHAASAAGQEWESDQLRHLFVIEEAHHLFRETEHKSENGPNSANHLVTLLNNLLAEIRAYGEGFLIVDQSPSALSASVLKNTAVKIVHRVDYGTDIQLLQSALLLNEKSRIPAALKRGEALVRYGSMHSPAMVHIHRRKQAASKDHTVHQESADRELPLGSDQLIPYTDLEPDMRSIVVCFLNSVLFACERTDIPCVFNTLAAHLFQKITKEYGWDAIHQLSEKECLRAFLEVAVIPAAEKMYPRQYALTRMIRMYVLRLLDHMSVYDNGVLPPKLWEVLEDYKAKRLFSRIGSFYLYHDNTQLRDAAHASEGSLALYESSRVQALACIINTFATAVWSLSLEQYDEEMTRVAEQMFLILPSPAMMEMFKHITYAYISELSD